jgi:hypothetical protein
MEAPRELIRLKQRIENDLRELQGKLDAVNQTMRLLERDGEAKPDIHRSREFANMGLAEACRAAIQTEFISPAEVRDLLVRGGFPSSTGKTKLLNSIYATIKRLSEKGEFERGKANGRQVFRRPQKRVEASTSVPMEMTREVRSA